MTLTEVAPALSDLEIAQRAKLRPIADLAAERLGIPEEHLELYGRYKAKLSLPYIDSLKDRPDGKLILVTAISPTPAGEGKTTTTVGLGDALNRAGRRTIMCLREPSLAPVFGMKGGAAGGGYAQVGPMEDINLHFTGDFHAIALANNLLSAMIDNHIHQGNELGFDIRRITWKRVMDMNDRALRDITIGLGGPANGYPRQDAFDIVPASEVMAIFCLSRSLQELKTRLGNVVAGRRRDQTPITARDLQANGAMAVLLKTAFQPNLVQTLKNNPAFLHGGPFANIAHGCNSILATQTALKLAGYVVTEAGFGADLGAEKFFDIKCRKSGMRPAAVVLVATIRALKYHGGVEVKDLTRENLAALEKGLPNLERHLRNLRDHFGMRCVVAINHFASDTDAEVELLRRAVERMGAPALVSRHWSDGGRGAAELAAATAEAADAGSPGCQLLYADSMPLWEKIKTVATKIYGATEVTADSKIHGQIKKLQESYGHYPVCIAKTQYSFSTDPLLRGAPSNHSLNIREVRLDAGAEFVVAICGDIMTMPGLPKVPSATRMDLDETGRIVGLS